VCLQAHLDRVKRVAHANTYPKFSNLVYAKSPRKVFVHHRADVCECDAGDAPHTAGRKLEQVMAPVVVLLLAKTLNLDSIGFI